MKEILSKNETVFTRDGVRLTVTKVSAKETLACDGEGAEFKLWPSGGYMTPKGVISCGPWLTAEDQRRKDAAAMLYIRKGADAFKTRQKRYEVLEKLEIGEDGCFNDRPSVYDVLDVGSRLFCENGVVVTLTTYNPGYADATARHDGSSWFIKRTGEAHSLDGKQRTKWLFYEEWVLVLGMKQGGIVWMIENGRPGYCDKVEGGYRVSAINTTGIILNCSITVDEGGRISGDDVQVRPLTAEERVSFANQATPEVLPDLRLEVGKEYLTEDGDKVRVITTTATFHLDNNGDPCAYVQDANGCVWPVTNDGVALTASGPRRIVSEVKARLKVNRPITIEKGKKYLTISGEVVEIVADGMSSPSGMFAVEGPFLGVINNSRTVRYHERGALGLVEYLGEEGDDRIAQEYHKPAPELFIWQTVTGGFLCSTNHPEDTSGHLVVRKLADFNALPLA